MMKPTAKGSPVTRSWSQRYRAIRGQRKLVKVRRIGGREQVRIVGPVCTTGNGAPRHTRRI
jgi:hypothetical protein